MGFHRTSELTFVVFVLCLLIGQVDSSKYPTQTNNFEDDVILIATVAYYLLKKRRMSRIRKKKSVWVNSYLRQRREKGRYARDFEDLRNNLNSFKENFHMSPDQFDKLLHMVKEDMTPKQFARKSDSISAEEQLCMTLEFLASGTLQRHIASVYRISKQRAGPIIERTCEAIYKALKPTYMQEFSTAKWTTVANTYNAKWNFPNCLGAVDGKHVQIKCPPKASSLFFIHKGFHSINLMAVADADYGFLYVDIGAYGSEGDSGVFRNCSFGKSLMSNDLNLPESRPVHGKMTPFLFIADDAFPLHKNIMKPFKPSRRGNLLPEDQRIFNYRLSRARRCVENAFGVLCARWICLARVLFVNPDRAQKIVAACCMLHNFLMKEDQYYCPAGFADVENEDGTYSLGKWRNNIPVNSMFNNELTSQNNGRPSNNAERIRNHLASYFVSEEGSLSWQRQNVYS